MEALSEAHFDNYPHYSSLSEEVSGINALPVEHLSRCDLEGVTALTLSSSFDTWREQVSKLSEEVRSQIKDLSLCGKKGSLKFEDIERTLDRETYLNSCPEEPATDLSVLELFPSLNTLRFFAVRNFDVNEFGKMDWRKIAMFKFSDMNIGPKMEGLGKLKVRDLFSLDLSHNILDLNKIPGLVKDLKERCPEFCDLNLGLVKDLETRVARFQALERNLLREKISVIRAEVKSYDQRVEIFYDDESEFQSSFSTAWHSDEASGPGA